MKSNLHYDLQNGWKLTENNFYPDWHAKYESIFALGNGYLGMRAVTEENYYGEIRNTFVSGTFNKFDENEVTELPNVPDLLQMKFYIDGKRLDLTQGKVENYERSLNLKAGELTRSFIWEYETGKKISFKFRRFVSMAQQHVIAQEVEITPLSSDIHLEIESGINGQVSNSGSQHFTDGDKRLVDGRLIQSTIQTTESAIDFVLTTTHSFAQGNHCIEPSVRIEMRRRQVFNRYWLDLSVGKTYRLEKISTIYTSRDKGYENLSLEELQQLAVKETRKAQEQGFNTLLEISKKAWDDLVWHKTPIKIHSTEPIDQLAIRFAQYHLAVMTPKHDERMNIGAKGLSGEGYKGHTFWDTEIFMLPYYIYTHPEIAKKLLTYRYLGLTGAHKKAKENGYEGAQFPWEAAWIDDGETTPVWGAADIITGEPTKIWSGFIEQHITSDVAYGVYQYMEATQDMDFMEKMGYEILLDTAKFWASRLEWNEQEKYYEIKDVIGPDEYKEHVNNNAFTNYTAKWNIEKAIAIYNQLKSEKSSLFEKLNKKLALDKIYPQWLDKVNKIFLPQPTEDGIIPQDDSYLSKKILDVSSYKADEKVGTLFYDYNLEQVNEMQITKQADVLLLMLLFENLFSQKLKEQNWDYYEPKTMHDSSLSLSTHSILASDLGKKELAYHLFKQAIAIDMGQAMHSSDEGIHAASLGGIWQMVVFGFGGVRALDGKLRIEPHLPDNWSELEFGIYWHDERLSIHVTHDRFTITKENDKPISFEHKNQMYTVQRELTIPLKQ